MKMLLFKTGKMAAAMFFPSSDLCRGLARPGREGRSLSDKIQMWLSLFDDKDGDKDHDVEYEDNDDQNI